MTPNNVVDLESFVSAKDVALSRRSYPMKACLFFVVLTLSACNSGEPPTQNVSFASGRATVPLPGKFLVTTAEDGLLATFGADGDHRLELTLLDTLSNAQGASDLAVGFVQAQGAKKGVKVSTANGRAVLMESGAQEGREGKTFQSAHWQIAVGNCLFTMTVTAPLPMSKELDAFLGEPLNALVQELSCAAL